MFVNVPNAGQAGVVKDLSKRELPLGAWTDASNVRFLDGYCQPFLGHGNAYGTPSATPLHVLPVAVGDRRYWLYAGSQKLFAVAVVDGVPVHTNLTRTTSTPGLKYAAQPAFGRLGQESGLMANSRARGAQPFADLLRGTLNNARSDHTPSPSFSTSALQYGLMPANAPSTGGATLTVGVITNDDSYMLVPNQITSTLLSGIPIINPGNLTDPPQRWNLDANSRFQTLDNWPAGVFCKSLRSFKSYVIALNITENGQNYPFMVWWSHPADPGGVPISWDWQDETVDAGRNDLAESNGHIVDGLPLRDSFMIYKTDSVWRMTPSGNAFIFNFQKVAGTSGALNRNCIVDLDQFHLVLTGNDVIVHDGQTVSSILDKQARRALFADFDVSATDRAFVVKNPFFNEAWICYASVGNAVPNKALVWNYVDRTVSYRELPAVHHAAFGQVDGTLGDSWAADSDPWESDQTLWNGPDAVPNTSRVLMASDDAALYLLDTSATFNGIKPSWHLERVGLAFDADDKRKLIKGIRPRITGNAGETVIVQVGGSDDPYTAPTYGPPMTYTIGKTLACDCFVDARYPAVRFSSGTAYFARLDSYDLDITTTGSW